MDRFGEHFYARHPHLADWVDVDEANQQATLLRANGLDTLNQKVLTCPRGEVLDVIAEHNVAALLIRGEFSNLEYEPRWMPRPVDFVGRRAARLYCIEVKRLGASDHDALHSAVMSALNRALDANPQRVAVSLEIVDSFELEHINALLRHIKKALRTPSIGAAYYFPSEREWLVRYHLAESPKRTRSRVIATVDAELRIVTGVEASRARGKIKHAYDKFKGLPAVAFGAATAVILEADRTTLHLSSVADALYGREYTSLVVAGGVDRRRVPDGLFCRGHSSRLGGVVIARRRAARLFVPYDLTIFPNPGAALSLREAVQAMGIGDVFGPDHYP